MNIIVALINVFFLSIKLLIIKIINILLPLILKKINILWIKLLKFQLIPIYPHLIFKIYIILKII